MNDTKDLNWWKARADHWITPLENAKAAARRNRERIDQERSTWKEAYDRAPSRSGDHDARREYFVTLQVILQNAQLSYSFMRDQLTEESWWNEKAGQFLPSMAHQALREHALMVKFFTVHALAAATEETLRAIVRNGGPAFTASPSGPLQAIYKHVLKVTDLQQLEELFEIVRLTRNTIHTNGFFFPNSGKSETHSYAGRTCEFTVGDQLAWLGEDFLVWMSEQMNEAMINIVLAPQVANIGNCPRA